MDKIVALGRIESASLNYAGAYRPYVRAQLCALYECLGYPFEGIKNGLNPTSRYKLGISPNALPTATNK